MQDLITKHGGPAAFSRKTSIPLPTVKKWNTGERKPSKWVEFMIQFYLDHTNGAGISSEKCERLGKGSRKQHNKMVSLAGSKED